MFAKERIQKGQLRPSDVPVSGQIDIVRSVILVFPRNLLILRGSLTVSMSSVKEER